MSKELCVMLSDSRSIFGLWIITLIGLTNRLNEVTQRLIFYLCANNRFKSRYHDTEFWKEGKKVYRFNGQLKNNL